MRKVLTVAAAIAVSAVLLVGSAMAHTHVYDSNPEDGSSVDAVPGDVTVRFGTAEANGQPLPPQPGQASEARLEIFDACGTRIDNDDSAYDNTDSSVTTSVTGGDISGRYEIHWYVVAADGASQAEALDFVVKNGSACEQVVRPDADADIDLGFNVTEIKSVPTAAGADVSIALKDKVACKDFATDSEKTLEVAMDTSYDEQIDYTGDVTCETKKKKVGNKTKKVSVYKLAVTKAGDDDPSLSFKVRKTGATGLAVAIPASILGETEDAHLDLHVSSTTDSDECTEGTICADRAPDLGWVRSF